MAPSKIILFIFLGIFAACNRQPEVRVPDLSDSIDYTCREIEYVSLDTMPKEISGYKYYNEQGQLIEQVGYERRTKFKYDSQGKLIEKQHCRIYNCKSVQREIFVYDENGNLMGSYFQDKNKKHQDKLSFQPVKFYDSTGHLIKELVRKGTDMNGESYERWKHYQYKNGKISNEIEIIDKDTLWTGVYKYDSNNNLLEIRKQKDTIYLVEVYTYSPDNLLLKKSIRSNRYPLTENTAFQVYNYTDVYEYDRNKRLIKKTTYNHKGEVYRTFYYIFDCK